MNQSHALSPGSRAALACIWEVIAPKAGNVSPGRPFLNLTAEDFLTAAVAMGALLDQTHSQRCGLRILNIVRHCHQLTQSNANLGIVLLLTPLVCALEMHPHLTLQEGVKRVLGDLNAEDCADVYAAIRSVMPGGIGETDDGDIRGSAPQDLIAAMRLAEDRDAIAHCYANDYSHLFDEVVPVLQMERKSHPEWTEAIRWSQIRLLAKHPDSLIARKCGIKSPRSEPARRKGALPTGR